MKRLISLALSLMMISCLGVTTFAAEYDETNNDYSVELGADEDFLHDKHVHDLNIPYVHYQGSEPHNLP